MKQILLITFLLFLLSDIYGQRTCGSELNLQFIKQNDPERYQRIMLMEQHVTNYKNQRNLESTSHHAVITIPVVVHVLHTGQAVGTGLNISLAQIQSQINVLNEDFRRLNADASNTPSDFQSVASDSEFEFVLACVDPNGNPTNGIVRVQTSVTTFQQNLDDVKYDTSGGSNAWPADRYLNIWVAERVEFLGQEILGYAQFPDMMATQPDTDGVVIRTSAFGRTGNVVAPWHKGRTATHEVGHWLNLRHIWGDSICGDDFVADTPTQSTSSSDCPNHPRTSCGSMDMFMNYMDYTDDRCMNLFTQCQKSRMITVLENSPRRLSWQYSLGAVPPPGYGNDLRITKIISPTIISCDNEIFPQIKLLNSGTKVINDFKIAYQIDDLVKDTIVYSGYNIAPGEQREINFPSVALTNDQHEFEVKILTVEGEEDTDTSNNHKKVVFTVNNDHDFIPLKETFTYEDAGDMKWSLINPDNQITWARVKTETGNFAASVNAFNYASVGSEDWLISPVLDFSNTMEASMQFSISYAYRENYNDLLKIMVSTDCGNSLFTMYEKFTRSLAVGNKDDAWEPSSERDWEKEFIDLSDFAGEERVRIAFVFINGNSNNIFIDDIEFFTSANPDAIVLKEKNSCQIYPNPSDQSGFNLAFNLDERDEVEISILDAIGRILMFKSYPNTINQTYHFQLTSFKPGVYFVKVKSNYFNMTKPVIFY